MSEDIQLIAVLDKDKLPDEIRQFIEKKFLQKPQDSEEKPKNDTKIDTKIETKDNKLFAIQTGMVVGNIYTDKQE